MTASDSRDLDAVRRARAKGRQRGDQVCRVASWPREHALTMLRSQLLMAEERVDHVACELAYAQGQADRLRERVATGDVELTGEVTS